MADKMWCPGCDSYTSGVLDAYNHGDGCPYCRLSYSAGEEIRELRRKRADEELKAQLERALLELDKAKYEAQRARSALGSVRRALDTATQAIGEEES